MAIFSVRAAFLLRGFFIEETLLAPVSFLVDEMRAIFLGAVLVGAVILVEDVFFPDFLELVFCSVLFFAEAVFFDMSFFC